MDYYVSENGDDSKSGNISDPFETIQKAVDVSAAGDTIHLRAGSYHESVNLANKNGTAGSPITIKSFDGEEAILDGRIEITSSWVQHSGSIYKTTVNEDIWQLWVDDDPTTLARWPDVKEWTEEFWDQSTSWGHTSAGNVNGTVEDDELKSIGDSLVGCVMVMNSSNWKSRGSVVATHTPGTDTFTYSPLLADYKAGVDDKPYFLTGLSLLKSADSWFYDGAANTLYLWAADGADPTAKTVLAKNQTYFFDGGEDASYITLSGLKFVGTTVSLTKCPNVSIVDCDFLYPVCSKRTLGSYADPAPTDLFTCIDLLVKNCTFKYSDGRPLFAKKSDYCIIENNLFYQIDYACLATGSNSYTLQIDTLLKPTYRRNEINIAGASEGCRISGGLSYPNAALVEYNYHTRTGLMQTDGGTVQYPPYGCVDSINRFNWFLDIDSHGFRFDGDPAGEWGIVYRNVSKNSLTHGFRIKGNHHKIYNNVGLDCGKDDINISLNKGPVADNGESNHDSITRNNAAQNVDLTDNFADNDDNWDGVNSTPVNIRTLLRDVDNMDFRPVAGSALINEGTVISEVKMSEGTDVKLDISETYNGSAPDIGAYEGDDSNYWIPGRILPRASMPVPPNGTTTAKTNCDLMWLKGADVVSFDIYFGTVQGAPVFKINQTNNIYTPTPSLISGGGPYYWRIDTRTAGDVIVGDEWSFDTASGSPAFNGDYIYAQMALSNSSYSYDFSAEAYNPNPAPSTLTFTKESGPAWASVSGAGVLTGTPGSTDRGTADIVVRATNTGGSGGYDESTVRIYVVSVATTVEGLTYGGETGVFVSSLGSTIDVNGNTTEDMQQYGHATAGWVLFSGTSVAPAEYMASMGALHNFASPITIKNNNLIKFTWADGVVNQTGTDVFMGIANEFGSLGTKHDPFTEFMTFDVNLKAGSDYILRMWYSDQRVQTEVKIYDTGAAAWSDAVIGETGNDRHDLRWHKITIQNIGADKTISVAINIKNSTTNSSHQLSAFGGITLEKRVKL